MRANVSIARASLAPRGVTRTTPALKSRIAAAMAEVKRMIAIEDNQLQRMT